MSEPSSHGVAAAVGVRSGDGPGGVGALPVSLVDVLDRILDKGVVVAGDLMISVGGVDLIYVNLRLLVSAVETAMKQTARSGALGQPARSEEWAESSG